MSFGVMSLDWHHADGDVEYGMLFREQDVDGFSPSLGNKIFLSIP